MPEPWLRGTHTDVPAQTRAVLHSIELAQEDIERWCEPLSEEEWSVKPYGLPSIAFQVRHIAGSLDRLLSYAEDKALTAEQLEWLARERDMEADPRRLMAEFRQGLSTATIRVRAIDTTRWPEPRTVGRRKLPSTVAGLLIHCADHTQRHVGQAVNTAKLLVAMRQPPE